MTDWQPPRTDPLLKFTDDAVHDEARQARSLERSLRERASESATFVGTLRDLAERGLMATVTTTGGDAHRGHVVAVAVDHLVVRTDRGVIVALASVVVATVRPEPAAGVRDPAMGDRELAQDRTLLEFAARAAEDRPRVRVGLRGAGAPLHGELAGVGEDVLSLRLDGSGDVTYVTIGAVAELALI